ncbi:MAG: tetratricopeptide repeat protein [Ferruginibacter sp.]
MKNKILLSSIFFFSIISFDCVAQTSKKVMPSIQTADSLFLAKEWKQAKNMYESLLTDTSHNPLSWMRLGFSDYNLGNYGAALTRYNKSLSLNPRPPIKGILLWRRAKIYALQNEKQKACTDLDSANAIGYSNLQELDSLKDFNSIRMEPSFKTLRHTVYVAAFPCMEDPHAREFDFWIGDWDVFVTGTKTFAGHNTILKISSGCALLENWESSASNGKSINYIDPITNKWKQAWAGSYANGVQEFANGEYKDGAMRFDFETRDAAGNKQIGRFIFYNQGPNQVRQFNETSADGGKTWVTSYDFTYIRKK